MVDKLNRKLTLIIGAFVVATIALLILPFRLGMDLKGGTRLLYSIDIQKAREEGRIDANLTNDQVISEVIEVWSKRLDPQGIKGVSLRKEGSNGILVELPATMSQPAKRAVANLAVAYEVGNDTIELTEQAAAAEFPRNGGRVTVGNVPGSYREQRGNLLIGFKPDAKADLTDVQADAGATVTLEASDPWRSLIENTGSMEIYMRALEADVSRAGTSLTLETEKAKQWLLDNPTRKISEYNDKLAAENPDSPLARIKFFPRDPKETNTPVAERLVAVRVDPEERFQFGAETIPTVRRSFDNFGRPAVGFDIATNRTADFAAFTRKYSENQEQMAIIVNGILVTDPTLNTELNGGGIIEGGGAGFRQEEVDQLVRAINAGALNVEPRFEDRETVGASLGEEYIFKGQLSIILGLVIVLAFVIVYYKRLGMYAALSLVFNLVLLMGAMAALQATLTLPGIAGIILTVGMAVDANILIYERIREESLRGRKPLQSAKDGFGNALSTIVDANLTTLIVAILLYNFGSGPVQGFATTLIVGILTSMFSALVFTRVLIHFALEKGVDEWKMMRLVNDTDIGFMKLAKTTRFASIALIIGGVAFFSLLPKKDKFSIEFVGGVSMQVQTAEGQDADTIRDALKSIDGFEDDFADAQVQPLLSSAADGGYKRFQIEFKADTEEESDAGARYRPAVEAGLADILSPNRVTFESIAEGSAIGTVHFEEPHLKEDVQAALADAGIGEVEVSGEGQSETFAFTASTDLGEAQITDRIADIFSGRKDKAGNVFTLAQPIPQSSAVGAEVVQELRNDSFWAIMLSLFAVVMYIRLRFAEYSYGFAAVIALVHDVLITLGFLALAISTGLINAQISLVMIAAFLTIIGYSLNDTIVVFDRIRENLKPLEGKMSLSDIIDKSINQTLARTVLTSLTTLLTVVILFVFNVGSRNDLEGFAYATIIGVIVGTYSSMFIASPALLWLETRRQEKLAEELAREAARSGDKPPTPPAVTA